MVSDRAFIFHMYIPWGKPFLSYQNQVISQGQSQISKSQFMEKKGGFGGICVSQKHLVIPPQTKLGGFILESQCPSVRPGHNFKSIKASYFKLHAEIGHIVEKCTVQEP